MAWREGNRRLFESFVEEATEDQPTTMAGMAPLLRALSHGVEAGEVERAFVEVYWRRVEHGNAGFLVHKLGALGAMLAALSLFFEELWSRPDRRVSAALQVGMFGSAAFALRAVGRLEEAVGPMEAALTDSSGRHWWRGACANADNLCELHVPLGQPEIAVARAREAVAHADRSSDAFLQVAMRTTLADALAWQGKRGEARALFEDAENMQAESQPAFPLLSSLGGHQYCDLLLDLGHANEVLRRVGTTLPWGEQLLSTALGHLSLARAHLALDDLPAAAPHVTSALDGLRAAGTLDMPPPPPPPPPASSPAPPGSASRATSPTPTATSPS